MSWKNFGRPLFTFKTLCKNSFDFLSFFEPVWPLPGLRLASLLAPFGSLWPSFWLPLASFGLPFGAFCHPLASSRLPWSFSGLQSFSSPAEAKFWRDLAKILPRFCRERAKNLPRTSQEPAKNPPYDPRAKMPFKLRILRNDFFRRQTLSQNRLE